MILPAALSGRFFIFDELVWGTLFLVALFLTWTVVGGRRFPSVAVVNGRRLQPTFGHVELISMSIVIGTATSWQPSELSVEERKLL